MSNYLNAAECAKMFGVKKETFLRNRNKVYQFPQPIKHSKKSLMWDGFEVLQYFEKKKRSQSNKSAN